MNHLQNKSIPAWAGLCAMTIEDLPTQQFVYGSEIIELVKALRAKNYQEVVDGAADVDWMVNIVKTLSTKNDNVIDAQDQLDALLEMIEEDAPGLLDQYFDEFKQAVLDSNYSKFCYSLEEVEQTREKYAAIGVPIYHVASDGGAIVVRCAETVIGTDGEKYPEHKVLKSVNYFKPKIVVTYGQQ